MRILIVHNYYQDPGGEDAVFEQESKLLSTVAEVETIKFKNLVGLSGLIQFGSYPWNIKAMRRLRAKTRAFKPDIVHIHNIHYAIGPYAIRMFKRHNIPIVMTLHNYRLLCPTATLYYDGEIFCDSLTQKFPWKAVKSGVFGNSRIKTFWLAFTYYLHAQMKTWNMVDRYLVLSDFAKQLFTNSTKAISPEKFVLKPNFLPDPLSSPVLDNGSELREPHFLFVGRLTDEKGVSLLLKTFEHSNCIIKIAGDGPLRDQVQQAAKTNPSILYLGKLNTEEVKKEMMKCTALIFPSLWFEGMPMTIIEAFATGTPVIASRLGAMQYMIKDQINGILFEPGDQQDLSRVIHDWSNKSSSDREKYTHNSRDTYETGYTPERNLQLLLNIYQSILEK